MANTDYNVFGNRYECHKCGASIDKNTALLRKHSNWHAEMEKGIQVSAVKWCDVGDHSFKADTPGAMSFTGQQMDENGVPKTVSMDVCSVHSGNVFSTPEQRTMREVESAYKQTAIDDPKDY